MNGSDNGISTGTASTSRNPLKGKSLAWIFRSLFFLAVGSTVLATVAGALLFFYFSRDLPKIITVEDYRPPVVTRILGNGGKEDALIGEFSKERRYLIDYERIPKVVVQAFISAEDEKFFEHQGVNFASMIRASFANFRAGHVVQGGSTITQQVAKSLLLTPERSFGRKIKEIILAHRIEQNLKKQQILYLYLNQIFLGHRAYGIQAAAKNYFHKDASNLNLAEAALLAGLPQAPGKMSPNQNPRQAKFRQLYVLRRMKENGYVTQAQYDQAASEPLRIYDDEDVNRKYAGYLVEYIRQYLIEKFGEKALLEDGLTVAVPASPELALSAHYSLQEGLRAVDKRIGYRGPLQHLNSPDEIEHFLREERIRLIRRKLGFQMFLPDHTISALESLKSAGITSDLQLLDPNELYEAVVTSVDDKRKIAGVLVGAIKAEIPMEHLKWARKIKDEKNPLAARGDFPVSPSQVVSKGDVVYVRLAKSDGSLVTVTLEQEPVVQGALLSLDAQTGNVLAMEGGYDFKLNQFNRAMQAQRQPGSAFKPIIYSAALEKGFTPATIIVDSPIVYNDELNGKWKPSNFEEKFYGDTTFRQALIKSRNVPTIKIVQQLQVPYLIDYAKRLGMQAQFNADLSISLGSLGISLYEITRAYALFPRLGKRVNPIFVSQVHDRDGKLLEENDGKKDSTLGHSSDTDVVAVGSQRAVPSPEPSQKPLAVTNEKSKVQFPTFPLANDPDQLMDPRAAYVMTHLMKEVVNYGTGHDAKALNRPAAGKTGTTNESIDAWFMGFTPNVVTGVWVGYDSQKTIAPGETGAKAALPIWLSYMREAVKAYPDADFAMPPGVVFASIDPVSGKLAAPNSSQAIKEAFIEGTEPTEAGSPGGPQDEAPSDFLKEDIE